MPNLITILQTPFSLVLDPLVFSLNWLYLALSGTNNRGVSLIVISALIGIGLLFAYGRLSNQQALRRSKDKIIAALLESFLYRNQLRVALRAQGRMIGHTGEYFRQSILPLIILSLPMIFILAQLNLHYNFNPIAPQQPLLLAIETVDNSITDSLKLDSSSSAVKLETPLLRERSKQKLLARISTNKSGTFPLQVQSGAIALANLQLVSGDENLSTQASLPRKIQPLQCQSSFCRLLYPSKTYLPRSSPLKEVRLSYPQHYYNFLGFELHWLLGFFIISLFAAIMGSRIFSIEL